MIEASRDEGDEPRCPLCRNAEFDTNGLDGVITIVHGYMHGTTETGSS